MFTLDRNPLDNIAGHLAPAPVVDPCVGWAGVTGQIICATRRSDISREEFDSYWREKHGPLVKSVAEFAPHVRKYVQCHLVEGTAPFGISGDYDGVAELWFDSVDEAAEAFSEPKYLEIIRFDELKFADPQKCISFMTEELQVI